MKLAQLYSTVVVLCSQLSIALRFRDRPSELILMRLSTRIFSHEIFFFNQSTACLSPSAEYSQGISKPFPAPRFTLFPVILQLILLFGNQRNINIHRLKHFVTSPTTNPSFTTATAFLSSTFVALFYTQDILQSQASIFLVHMITTNIRVETVIFCLFVNHFFIHFGLHCLSSKTDIHVVSVQ